MVYDYWNAWRTMVRAGTMVGETLDASRRVVAVRHGTISAAMNDPFNADHRELALMVNEKTAAFATAGTAMASNWLRMQTDLMAQAVAVSTMLMSGKVPSARTGRTLMARNGRIGNAALAGSVKALGPIHAAATGNARRLKKR